MAELLFDHQPNLTDLRARLATSLPESEVIDGNHALMVFHRAHAFLSSDGKSIPPQTIILHPDPKAPPSDTSFALSQTRDWPGAEPAVSRCTHHFLVTELMCRPLTAAARIRLFHDTTAAIIASTSPRAIYAIHADRLVDPASAIRPIPTDLAAHDLPLFFNVRFIRVENSPGDCLIDSRGLAELGLPDLQCHFRGLEPGRVAALLYNLITYGLTHGDCIEDGHTVQGLEPNQRWRCQHESSLLGPRRIVLDINPGPPFAAGNRR
jgi:hypothetical protein